LPNCVDLTFFADIPRSHTGRTSSAVGTQTDRAGLAISPPPTPLSFFPPRSVPRPVTPRSYDPHLYRVDYYGTPRNVARFNSRLPHRCNGRVDCIGLRDPTWVVGRFGSFGIEPFAGRCGLPPHSSHTYMPQPGLGRTTPLPPPPPPYAFRGSGGQR